MVALPLVVGRRVKTGHLSTRTAALMMVWPLPFAIGLGLLLRGGSLLIVAIIEVPLILMAKLIFLPFANQLATDLAPAKTGDR